MNYAIMQLIKFNSSMLDQYPLCVMALLKGSQNGTLFLTDIIALSTAIGLSHDMFDGVLNLGICDKIVPGLLIGNLSFGHNHSIFLPGGPMKTGISNEKQKQDKTLQKEK